jgi:hypothetical protein
LQSARRPRIPISVRSLGIFLRESLSRRPEHQAPYLLDRQTLKETERKLTSRHIQGLCLVLLGCLIFSLYGYHQQTRYALSYDFKTVYVGARCLIDGCDPYDAAQTEAAYLRHNGNQLDHLPIRPFNTVYPPSSLFLVTPLALLHYPAARAIWLTLGIVLFSVAALCMADLCRGRRALWVHALLALFVVSSTLLVMLGQPSLYSISLVVIAAWSFLRRRSLALGVLAFAISLTLKPQTGAFVWLFFLLSSKPSSSVPPSSPAAPASPGQPAARAASRRRLALYTMAATLLLSVPGVLLAHHHPASAHWPQELDRSLQVLSAPQGENHPGPRNGSAIANLQALFALWRDSPRFYNLLALATFLPLFLAWLYLLPRRPPGPGAHLAPPPWGVSDADLMALAAAATLSLLPIYHQQYDTRLLLLIFPAAAALASRYRRLGTVALALSVLATINLGHTFVRLLNRLVPQAAESLAQRGMNLHGSLWLTFDRPLPLTLLLLSCFFLYAMFRVSTDADGKTEPAQNGLPADG